MKMKNIFYSFLLLSLITSACGPSMNATWQKSGYSPRPVDNVAIITISNNLEARQSIESNMISDLRKNHSNYKFYTGTDLFPPSAGTDAWTEDNIEKQLKENNIDLVITSSVINSYISKELVNDYPMGSNFYYPIGYRIYSTYNYIYTPSYYESDQHYVIQTNVYDLKESGDEESKLVWQGQSEVIDPYSISDGADEYTSNLVKYLDKNDLLR